MLEGYSLCSGKVLAPSSAEDKVGLGHGTLLRDSRVLVVVLSLGLDNGWVISLDNDWVFGLDNDWVIGLSNDFGDELVIIFLLRHLRGKVRVFVELH